MFDRFARRAVEIAVHLGPFQQLAGVAQDFEIALRDETDNARPPISLGRRARVVTEIDRLTFVSSFQQRSRVSVVLPAPDGEETPA